MTAMTSNDDKIYAILLGKTCISFEGHHLRHADEQHLWHILIPSSMFFLGKFFRMILNTGVI